MRDHAAEVPASTALYVAREVRAELARQRRTIADLAQVVGITPHTAGRRLDGSVPFDVVELIQIADWLGVDPTRFMPPSNVAVTA